ncbi:MAG: metallophosphoesterase [Micavibrio sp.]|nr:metallophosphoesterase [Micavibrio sp.]
MRIIHLSDLHFGTVTDALQRDLIAHIRQEPADLVIVSGDFTQTGSAEEFKKAHEFLTSLDIPYFCVPGNHDIPRYKWWHRITDPYRVYKKYIAQSLFPMWEKENVCIAGINTARPILPHWNWANGAVSMTQLYYLENYFWAHTGKVKICVMHHPIHISENSHSFKTVVFGSGRAMQAIKDMKVDLVLTGHVHHASITQVEEDGHKTIFLSASTALSTRLRMQKNGYNIINIHDGVINIDICAYENGVFKCIKSLSQVTQK